MCLTVEKKELIDFPGEIVVKLIDSDVQAKSLQPNWLHKWNLNVSNCELVCETNEITLNSIVVYNEIDGLSVEEVDWNQNISKMSDVEEIEEVEETTEEWTRTISVTKKKQKVCIPKYTR